MIQNFYFNDTTTIDLHNLKNLVLRIPVDFEYDDDTIKKSIFASKLIIYIISKKDPGKELKIYNNYIQYEMMNSIIEGNNVQDKNNCLSINLRMNKYLEKLKKIDVTNKLRIEINGIKDNRIVQLEVTRL